MNLYITREIVTSNLNNNFSMIIPIISILGGVYIIISLTYFTTIGDNSIPTQKNMTPLLSACPHGFVNIALCTICSSMAQHFSIISLCTHKWSKLNYDANFVRNANCDLAGSGGVNGSGAWDSIHHAVNNMGDIAYYCSQCHAICCINCIAL